MICAINGEKISPWLLLSECMNGKRKTRQSPTPESQVKPDGRSRKAEGERMRSHLGALAYTVNSFLMLAEHEKPTTMMPRFFSLRNWQKKSCH